jgi:translation initiation factor 2B subunit (eIF-2B alpha/beta/delta family)
MVELKDSQYQSAAKILASAIEALHQAISGLKRKEESTQLRRRIEEVEGILKKAKRELRLA